MLVTILVALASAAVVAAVVVATRWSVERRRHEATRGSLAACRDELRDAQTKAGELEEQRSAEAARATAAEQERDRLAAERAELEAVLTETQARAEEAAAELATARDEVWATRRAGHDAASLWALELARSERRWRLGVAPGLHLDSPFTSTGNPLATAVQVESDALHEEAGTEFVIEWEVPWPVPPETAVLAMRLCEEILAACARTAETVTLAARTDGEDLVLAITARDDEGGELVPVLPAMPDGRVELGADLVRIRAATTGTPTTGGTR